MKLTSFFSFLTDGDGQSEHLLPVCEDEKCQRSAIYLTKLGLDQVMWIWNSKDKAKYCVYKIILNRNSSGKKWNLLTLVIEYKRLVFMYLCVPYLKKYGFGERGS